MYKCKECNNTINIDDKNGFLNWKCSECGAINPFSEANAVIWKCSTDTAKRSGH